MARKITNLYAVVLSGLLAALGFVSCNDDDNNGGGARMYGTLNTTYRVIGTAVDKESGKAVKGIRVVMANRYNGTGVMYGTPSVNYTYIGLDTAYTDSNGRFALKSYENALGSEQHILFKDVDGAENGDYMQQEVAIKYEASDIKEGTDGWRREITRDMGEVALAPGVDEPETE